VETLEHHTDLHMIVVLPRWTDSDNLISRIPQLLGRQRAMSRLAAAAPGRVEFYSPENEAGTPVYVHAKVCVVDDRWCTVGSDNFNRRSWTHDSELSAVVVDTAAEDHSPYARRLRLVLAAEHLGRRLNGPEYPGEVSDEPGKLPDDDELAETMSDCLDAEGTFLAFADSAAALEEWHRAGRTGPRPPGRLRPLAPPRLNPLTIALAAPAYLWLHDPDGRPWRLRLKRRY
jgi:phosphatidylserine/phosphatidylglycerophosphate/cardiolipin synthase-like enzyme